MVELTGDAAPDARAVEAADVIVTTPEKWDGVSRGWRQRGHVRRVGLVVIDEVTCLLARLVVSLFVCFSSGGGSCDQDGTWMI